MKTDINEPSCELSFVIPVYNGSKSIGSVVCDIVDRYSDLDFEVILVNDGSADNSADVCREIAQLQPMVVFANLSRNFGEHNAVLCGLKLAGGRYVAVLDDDGQNPPSEVRKLYDEAIKKSLDVVYGCYAEKKHHFFRNLGSAFNDRIANIMLKKPSGLYLSSFKLMTFFVKSEVTKYTGSRPYIDGLIFRVTRTIGQIEVDHKTREDGTSNYNLTRLIRLWLSMFVNNSILPLRVASITGGITALVSLLFLIIVLVEKLTTPNYPVGLPSILVSVVFFAGVQLMILGVIGEYLGRMFIDHSGMPPFLTKEIVRVSKTTASP